MRSEGVARTEHPKRNGSKEKGVDMLENGTNGDGFKRWTAKRKKAVVLDVIKGVVTPAEVARKHGLTVGEIEKWVDDGMRGMEDRLRSNPRDLDAAHEAEKKELFAKIGRLSLEVEILKKTQGIGSGDSGDGSW